MRLSSRKKSSTLRFKRIVGRRRPNKCMRWPAQHRRFVALLTADDARRWVHQRSHQEA